MSASNPLEVMEYRQKLTKDLARLEELNATATTANERRERDNVERRVLETKSWLHDHSFDINTLPDIPGRQDGTFYATAGMVPGGEMRADYFTPNHGAMTEPRRVTEEDRIFVRVLRTGDEGAARELRASNAVDMEVGTAAEGGNLVPTGHYNRIIAQARPYDLTSMVGCRLIPGTATTVDVPLDDEGDNGQFVATDEEGEYDKDSPNLGKVSMTVVKYTKNVVVSEELLWGEESGLLDFLETYVGQGMAATLNTLMVAEALANGTAAVTADSATAIGSTEIPELMYSLSEQYAAGPNVSWMMRRATEGYIRSISSSSVFTFAPTPAGRIGNQGELFGLPVWNAADMGALAASGKSLLIANWAYMGKRLSPAMTLLRDPYTLGSKGQVRFLYKFRADFAVLQSAAFQYLSHASA